MNVFKLFLNKNRCGYEVLSYSYLGADDIHQLQEAEETELLEILSIVGMNKPVHIKRFQKYLGEWIPSPG